MMDPSCSSVARLRPLPHRQPPDLELLDLEALHRQAADRRPADREAADAEAADREAADRGRADREGADRQRPAGLGWTPGDEVGGARKSHRAEASLSPR